MTFHTDFLARKAPCTRRSARLALICLIFYAALAAAFLLSLAVLPAPRFNTSLFDILPPSHSLKQAAKADAALGSRTSRSVTLLAYSEDFSRAKAAAERFYRAFLPNAAPEKSAEATDLESAASGLAAPEAEMPALPAVPACFEELSLYAGSDMASELTGFLSDNRFVLLDGDTIESLEQGRAETVAEEALSRIFGMGMYGLTDFSSLEDDPFDLAGGALLRILSLAGANTGAMQIHEGVLAAEHDGLWFVLLRGILTPDSTSLTTSSAAVPAIYKSCAAITADSGVRFAYSGVPFHSWESASSVQKQVTVISIAGILLIILLFLYIFRSPLPALISALAVAVSCGTGLVTVLLFFREIHVLTFVFGTTLIGTSLDYSIHFFVHWKADAACADGNAVSRKIRRGILLSFISTEICFASLFLAPFPFLRQVAVFLFTGLLSAFLWVLCLYPSLPLPAAPARTLPKHGAFWKKPASGTVPPRSPQSFGTRLCTARNFSARHFTTRVPVIILALAAITLLALRNQLQIDNNLRDMYTMSEHLFESEKITAQVLDYGSAGWYYLVSGDSPEAVLQTEEMLTQRLDAATNGGLLQSYLAVTSFIPSVKTQEQSYRAAEALLPLAKSQYETLGFSAEAGTARFATQYKAAAKKRISLESRLPAAVKSIIANLWLGEVDGVFCSVVMPLHTAAEEAVFRDLAADIPGVAFVNKVSDVGTELNQLTAIMLKLLSAAFVLVLILLAFFYPARVLFRIALIPLTTVLTTIAVLTLTGKPVGFFSVTGMVLVFGLGLDYIIYAIEGAAADDDKADSHLNRFAIGLSFLTTAVSFGALTFISFAPVHTIGLTVTAGLTTACLCAFCTALPQAKSAQPPSAPAPQDSQSPGHFKAPSSPQK
ncbi:MAG: MMPL family transporter [Treponema sp.]|nr:MMPL family transporter [Treponema sp.]